MKQHRAGRVLAAGGTAVNADARNVVVRIFFRDRLMPQNAIGKTGICQVVPANIVKRLRAIGRAHAVHLHDDETQIVERSPAVRGTKRLGNVRIVRARVDVLDDRVLFVRVEVRWPTDNAPNIGRAVAPLGDKHFGRLPSRALSAP